MSTTFGPPPSDRDRTEEINISPAEREARGESVLGHLDGEPIYVPPIKRWRSSGLKAMRDGDMEGWAASVLDEEDYAVWKDVDPTLEQIGSFFEDIGDRLGTDQGNSPASRRSLRNTARR